MEKTQGVSVNEKIKTTPHREAHLLIIKHIKVKFENSRLENFN